MQGLLAMTDPELATTTIATVASVAQGLLAVGVGGALVYGGAAEIVSHVRARQRFERTVAVVVGLVDAGYGARSARSRSRAAVLRFMTRHGQVVDSVSSLSSFPGPRVGKRFRVVYDPERPEGAERVGVRRLKLALSPLLIAGGLALVALGLVEV
jgi:hypothetical protein